MSSPEQAKWLTEEERTYIKARLQADQGHNAAERKITFHDVKTVMSDYKIWLGGFMYFGLIVPAYGYAFCKFFSCVQAMNFVEIAIAKLPGGLAAYMWTTDDLPQLPVAIRAYAHIHPGLRDENLTP